MDTTEMARTELIRFAGQEPVDLARAALAIAREEYPHLDEGHYLRKLDELGAQARAGVPSGASPERRMGRLSSFLFHELGFSGNRADYGDPKNSFLNEVLDRRTGIPITLSVVYIEVGRRCGLDVEGIGFPGHFLCKVSLGDQELVVDPFHRGQVVATDELRRRFRAAVGEGAPFDGRVLRAARPRDILVRMLQNLKAVYQQKGDGPRALSAVDRVLLLSPENVRGLRERADLREQLGGPAAAALDLEKVLALEPGAVDAEELRTRVRRLRGASRLLN